MEITYYTILPQFISIFEAIDYMSTIQYEFGFSVGTTVYDSEGNETTEPINSEIIPFSEIAMEIHDSNSILSPGQLCIKDGFIQYFKELKL